MFDVVVIGGGLAGLACGVALADSGVRVAVIERDGRLGGRAGSWAHSGTGDMVDVGPHVVHTEYRDMLALLERLGTRDLITWHMDKVLTIASKPRPVVLRHWPLPPPFSLFPSLLGAPGLTIRDCLSMRATTWKTMQFGEEQVPALDRMSALDFLRAQGVSQPMIDWWWKFAAMVVTNVPLEHCSAAALMRIHAQLSGHRRLHFGFAAVGLAELFAQQASQAIEAAGGRVLTGREVRAFIGSDRVEGVVLDEGTRLQAAHCVSAVPPQELAPLVPDAWKSRQPFDALAAFEPSPYVSCYLWFDRQVLNERFFAHLWSPTRLNYDFYDLSRIRRGWADRPSVIASNIIYSHRAHGMSDEDIVQATVRELAEFAPEAANAQVLHADVHHIPMAIPCPTPGTERKRPHTRTPIPGLVLAGDWVQTHLPCSMESAVRSGWLAAEQVLAERGSPRQIALPQRPYDGLAGLVRRATCWYRGRTAAGKTDP
ncbi:hydroxysqualene dehydroxylase [Noviherbaspirillum massiliense]|uniref:hydroxysqualene dehydroxylase n=1 Tax=Noviherbaspirillum massiliense TaxID=1465823 RepID=UPI0002D4A249|nr:FAD-dependent oxidoreductase [Noviherbaspirillum massiliense]